MTEEFDEVELTRSEEIFFDYFEYSGTFSSVGHKHKLSADRIRQIVRRQGRKFLHQLNIIENKNKVISEMNDRIKDLEHENELLKKGIIYKQAEGSDTECLFNITGIHLENLELSVRTQNIIRNKNFAYGNFEYIGDLIQKTEQEILRFPNCGRKSLNELKETLAPLGLKFGMDCKIISYFNKNRYRLPFEDDADLPTFDDVRGILGATAPQTCVRCRVSWRLETCRSGII